MTTNRIKKVSITLTVEVDADEWALDYGTPDDIRRDLRGYAADAVLYSNSAIKSVTVKGAR